MPQTIGLGSIWLLKRDQVPDTHIQIASGTSPYFFIAYYVIDKETEYNQSEFRINLWERELSLLQMLQYDRRTRYRGLHVGVARFTDPDWSGSWGDVTHPTVGKFTMSFIA